MFSLNPGRLGLAGLIFTTYVLWSGCRSYTPAPIDWARETSEWSATATNRVPLTLEAARQCALVLNPEINALRLSRQASEREALAAGWWNDPSFDLDALRILRGGAHPWILGSGLSFTLPLNGVPGIEKRAAQAYAHADALAVTVAERELAAQVGQLWTACVADTRCAAAQSAYLERLAQRERQVRSLVEAGELPASERDRLSQARYKLVTACPCCSADSVKRRQSLLRLIGLHPSTPFDLVSEADEPEVEIAWPDEEDLIGHPAVQEKLARLEGGEEALRAEIRRQYPDLQIGPRLEHEEGVPRAGATLGFDLPLWNRNRRAIAAAERDRDAARLEALNTWRSWVARLNETRSTLDALGRQERRIREEQLPAALEAAERAERLFAQGEADILSLLSAEESAYAVQEALLDVQRERAGVRIQAALLQVTPASQAEHEQHAVETPERNRRSGPIRRGRGGNRLSSYKG